SFKLGLPDFTFDTCGPFLHLGNSPRSVGAGQTDRKNGLGGSRSPSRIAEQSIEDSRRLLEGWVAGGEFGPRPLAIIDDPVTGSEGHPPRRSRVPHEPNSRTPIIKVLVEDLFAVRRPFSGSSQSVCEIFGPRDNRAIRVDDGRLAMVVIRGLED